MSNCRTEVSFLKGPAHDASRVVRGVTQRIGVPEDDSEAVKKKVMEMVFSNVFHLTDSPHFESLEFDEQVDIIAGVVAQIRSLDGTRYRLPANSTPWQVLGTPER